ncbi:sialidase family protein [Membranihabitans marinus]|uniref:sialidase family protein n=1 Tax=Membranihabitans marinus TaxID=1227546 RepID=UPI001F36528B|nr:sialidase family protein [Membranihabitans marinus]
MNNRRRFFKNAAVFGLSAKSIPMFLQGKKTAGNKEDEGRPLLIPIHDIIPCSWTPEHPRHDHQQIISLDNDRLMMVWSEYYVDQPMAYPEVRQGHVGTGDHVSCQISSMISYDRGRTWKERKVIQPNEWKLNVKHPNVIRLSDQEMLLFFVGWDSPAQRNVYMRRSLDNGRTWLDKVQISEPGYYCNNADRIVQLENGRIILPAHGPFSNNYVGGQAATKNSKLHAFVFYSDDGFKTWHRSEDSMTTKGRGCHEPTIVELKDGRLMAFLRNTNQRIYQSFSMDKGLHWTEPQPTSLSSPEAPSLIKRIPSTGDLLLLWNNVASASNWPRIPLTAAISSDEGKTWKYFRDIENREDCDAAYPSVSFVEDEVIVTYYSRSIHWKRDSEVTLRIYKLDQFYT